ncbi:hypothetical protein OJF2_64580 [Aquisphaera giovannonii]|uniref:Glycosyltransferase RgtA/B/C/D-like domain-containing protein n=2 Tax=Aquisphaera giovannonii TaxID=406548 RepID=A0A5B9WB95_9BACT|nr:hypothetical protein OJF2_64580 [Aquisphaera giovannonii]
MAAAAVLLTWLARHTDVIYADGLRYIAQARRFDAGSWKEVFAKGTDHPAYPAAIALTHLARGGIGPADWQAAGQLASVVAGVLLIVPVYLFALELFGTRAAWLACVLTLLVPLTGHVLADVLSEGTFLLFWMFGCWAGLGFLRAGSTRWLIAAVAFASLAYLVRPEGVLLPASLAATLVLSAVVPALRLPRARSLRAAAILLVGPVLLAGPFLLLKGGIATKPAVARLFGLSGRSAAMAVERERPLDPDQTVAATCLAAARAVSRAIAEGVSPILLPAAVAGIALAARRREHARRNVFLAVVASAWILALLRLHATGGYCTARHAMLLSLILIAFAAAGLLALADRAAASVRERLRRHVPETAILAAALLVVLAVSGRAAIAPVNPGYASYRPAGEWIAANTAADARILDLKGWASFYGCRQGYGFGEIEDALRDPNLRWVVAHDAFLVGPWSYCDIIRGAVAGKACVKSFPETPRRGVAQVHIFDRSIPAVATSGGRELPPVRGRDDTHLTDEALRLRQRLSACVFGNPVPVRVVATRPKSSGYGDLVIPSLGEGEGRGEAERAGTPPR